MADLHIIFIDELTVAESADVISFGRLGDVTVDEANEFMHRVVGAFFYQDNVWWVVNKSKHGSLDIIGEAGRHAKIPPDGVAALAESTGLIRFDAGPSTYEIGWLQPGRDPIMPPGTNVVIGESGETRQFGVVPLNDEQKLLLVALSERVLRDSTVSSADLPANAEVAHRLGWSGKKLDRKLDYLCSRLAAEGVRGLRGEKGFEAADRRSRLVDHVIGAGMVNATDIDLLPS